ncbi:MAG: hypothetical protein VB034_02850 [Eubacteriales bacterium]|nr:hypothetical protein [Eubacteriales bacterium]
MACLFGHKWNGCKCTKCGKTRDEHHDWNGCICRICGKTRDENHDWNGCKCRICGKVRDKGHEFVSVSGSSKTRCVKCGKEGYAKQKDVPATKQAEPAAAALPASAVLAGWMDEAEPQKWIGAIKKTWFVDVKAYVLSGADTIALEKEFPMDKHTTEQQAQYAVVKSTNSIFYHEYGAWNDFGYAKFLYKNKLYYINVAPTVKLTESLYNRRSDLDHMAKIFLCLMGRVGADRERVLFVLDGELWQE